MARWYEEEPRLVTGDFTHPTYTGAQQLGTLLVDALLKGFGEYKKNQGGPPCVPAVEPMAVDSGQKAEGSMQDEAAGGAEPQKQVKRHSAKRQRLR